MKKIAFLFSIILFSSVNIYSWDTTAAKYYPLAVGNKWSYHRINTTGSGCILVTSQYDYIASVISDTVLPNGKKYFKISESGIYRYERVDSASMNVYNYDGTGGECLLDSLLAGKNNTYRSCRSGTIAEHLFQDTLSDTFAGQTRKVRLINGSVMVSQVYKLMNGVGLYFESACEITGSRVTLNGCIINGIQYGTILGYENPHTNYPLYSKLFQNYPNPFNPTTAIQYEFSMKGNVQLVIFDITGKEIMKLVDEEKSPGRYKVEFSGIGLSSGIYLYQLIHNSNMLDTKKMLLIK